MVERGDTHVETLYRLSDSHAVYYEGLIFLSYITPCSPLKVKLFCLLLLYAAFLLRLLFDPEDSGYMIHQNVGWLSANCIEDTSITLHDQQCDNLQSYN
jgi:hypothetical protein